MKVNLGNNRPFIPYRGVVSIVGVYGPTDNLVPIGNVLNKGLTIRANQASVKCHLPNTWAEKGYAVEWKHNRKGLVLKLATLAAVVGGTAVLLTRTGSKPGRREPGRREPGRR